LINNHFIPPTGPFTDVLLSIWQVEGFTPFQQEHILPKGIVEVIFNFSDGSPIPAKVGNKQSHLSNCFINGFNTAPVQIELPEHQKFFGVQLQPLSVKKIFGVPACEFSDSVVDMTLLDPGIRSLWHQLAEQTSFDRRVAVFSNWIGTKLTGLQPLDNRINNFLSGLDQHDLSVTVLASSLYYSPRQLSRKITEATGMNTEEILLYKKYLHAVHLIHHTDLSLTKIAYQSHFSDQSHFIKSFKTFTKITPGDYKKSKGFVKGHIYENVR